MAKVTVWFDGACPLCSAEIGLMRRLDGKNRIDFVDVGSEDASCPIDRAELLARFHAQEIGKPVVSGAAAFGAMWRAVPLFSPLGQLLRIPLVLAVFEQAYRLWLRVRPRLQRAVARG